MFGEVPTSVKQARPSVGTLSRRPASKSEASALGRLLVDQVGHLQQCFSHGLRLPRLDPEVVAALGVVAGNISDEMSMGQQEIARHMVVVNAHRAIWLPVAW